LKKLIRQTSARFHSALHQSTLQVLNQSNKIKPGFILAQQKKILDNLGGVQHHDSITGTAKNRVSTDYYARAMQANDDTTKMLSEVLKPDLERDFGLRVNRITEGLMTKEVNMS
jgi:hypothetical protein